MEAACTSSFAPVPAREWLAHCSPSSLENGTRSGTPDSHPIQKDDVLHLRLSLPWSHPAEAPLKFQSMAFPQLEA